MRLSPTHVLLALLTSLAAGAPGACPAPGADTSSTPSPLLASGDVNPYYPCGSTAASARRCPFRCYSATASANATTSTSLLPTCFSEAQAHAMSASLRFICVACLPPPSPRSAAAVGNATTTPFPAGNATAAVAPACAPLDGYLNGTLAPARCGSAAQPLPACAWSCAAAQVPFSLCDAANTTQPLRVCRPCVPQCASPVLAFAGQGPASEVTAVDVGFDVGSGNCSAPGTQGAVACPWRCKAGGSAYAACRLADVSKVEIGTTCERCGV